MDLRNSNISRESAGEITLTHIGKISEGKRTERVLLNKDNSCYNIAVKTFNKSDGMDGIKGKVKTLFQRAKYVKVNVDGKDYNVNIRSAAKRLGISSKELKILAKQDNAYEALQNKATIRQASIEKYSSLVKNYKKNKGSLESKEGKVKTGLKPETLMKAIQRGFIIEENGAVFKEQKITVEKYEFFATRELKTLDFVQQKLGEGTFGVVFKTIELNTQQVGALKGSLKTQYVKDLKNEHTILSHLNKEGGHATLPPTPSQVTEISDKEGNQGFIRTKFMNGGDMKSGDSYVPTFQMMNTEGRLNFLEQLPSGLVYIHSKNVVHGDIKPPNILLNTENKTTRLAFNDFGGSRILDDNTTPTKFPTCSPRYTPADIRLTNDSLKKADVFALSITMIETLTATDLPSLATFKIEEKKLSPIEENSQQAKNIRKALAKNGIPEKVANVLLSGMAPVGQRPTAAEFLQAYQEAKSNMTSKEKQGKSEYTQQQELANSI